MHYVRDLFTLHMYTLRHLPLEQHSLSKWMEESSVERDDLSLSLLATSGYEDIKPLERKDLQRGATDKRQFATCTTCVSIARQMSRQETPSLRTLY